MFIVYGNEFLNLFMVIELCLIILVQIVCVERGNSCLNRIMIDYRVCFDVLIVSVLMYIVINGLSYVEYDVIRVVVRWFILGERRRRLEYLEQNKRDVEQIYCLCNILKYVVQYKLFLQYIIEYVD